MLGKKRFYIKCEFDTFDQDIEEKLISFACCLFDRIISDNQEMYIEKEDILNIKNNNRAEMCAYTEYTEDNEKDLLIQKCKLLQNLLTRNFKISFEEEN